MNNKILFYSEFLPRMTGIAYVNEIICKHLKSDFQITKFVISRHNNKIFNFFLKIFDFIYLLKKINNYNYFYTVYNFNLKSSIFIYILLHFIKKRNIKIFIHFHRVDFNNIYFQKLFFNNLKNINIVVLNSFQQNYLKKFNLKSFIIENTLLKEYDIDQNSLNRNFNFLYLGNYSKNKGYILLINTFERFFKDKFILHTYGIKLTNEYYNNIFKSTYNNIFIYNIADEDKKKSLLQNSYCIIIPSLVTETQSIVLLEAMYNGIPIIISNVGTNKDTIGEDYPFLISNMNSENLRDAINNFHNLSINQKVEISIYLKKRYMQFFSNENFISKLLNLFS
jgi:glycosyltransferase involved in cell wall biosynthesis